MMKTKEDFGGNLFVYARRDRDPAIAYSLAMGKGIPDENYFVDKPGEMVQFNTLMDTVCAGDSIIVGTITDFMRPDIYEMLNILEDLNEGEIKVMSMLEPDYNINLYRPALRIASRICNIHLGKGPV